MLKRIDWTKGCGFFENYRWDGTLPDLARINVIYGPNGSGKTSLAGALDGLRNAADSEGFRRISVSIADDVVRTTNGNDDHLFNRIHVFSEAYVARSHNFTAGNADMPAVLTIGEKPADAERKLEVFRGQLATKVEERKQQTELETEAKGAVDDAYGAVSQQVVDAASRAGGRWNSRSNFSAGVVRTAFGRSHATWKLLTEQELRSNVGVVNSEKADTIPENQLVVAVPDGLSQRLATALSTTPATIILDTLEAHPDATSWVDEGRDLHGGVDICIFCGAPFSDERRALIDQHFSDAVQRLQSDLQSGATSLRAVIASVDASVASLPSRGLFFEDLRPRYDEANTEIREELTALRSWATEVLARTETKLSNVLNQVDAVVAEPPTVSATAILELRTEHNDRVSQHDQLVQAAAQAIELHYLKASELSVSDNSAKAAEAKAEGEALDETIAGIRADIASLEAVDGDPMPSAKILTDEVTRLLGRNELKFELADGRYRVIRDGQPAQGLSLGERTAITLIHFLEQVAKFDSSNGKPIVIIDDPVSSLDSDIFMGVSTYIWTETIVKDHVAQLFLLSHNFELFRQWDIQIEALHNSGKMEDGRKFRDVYPTEFYEIRSRHLTQGGTTKRRPVLAKWPPSERARKMIRSTYHHAFMALADARLQLAEDDSMENRLDAQLLFPNVIRRVLESFLAFKHPEWVGNLNSAMRKSADLLRAAGYQGDADALRLRLTRYAHAYSHSESPATDITVSPDEVASAIASVFEFMHCLDEAHFAGLCEVTGILPTALLPPVPQAAEEVL
ncbi:AAA family ATPase [Leucobacter sp. Z1108]|uniref:AAA family ATPase n=1 Tax=Leucobacter sp. Z1108 TaxID=3439066 RepID=UPI003F39EFAE